MFEESIFSAEIFHVGVDLLNRGVVGLGFGSSGITGTVAGEYLRKGDGAGIRNGGGDGRRNRVVWTVLAPSDTSRFQQSVPREVGTENLPVVRDLRLALVAVINGIARRVIA